MMSQDFGSGEEGCGAARRIAEQGMQGRCDALGIGHAEGCACFAEACRQRLKVAGVRADEDGSARLQRLDHVLSAVVDGAGEAFANKGDARERIQTGEFSCGIEEEHLGRGSRFRTEGERETLGSECHGDGGAVFDMSGGDQ